MGVKKDKLCKFISKLLEWIVFIALLFTTGFFVKDVWKDFRSHDTSIKVSTEVSENYSNPTVTFCFVPSVKESVINAKAGSLKNYFRNFRHNESKIAYPWPETYFEASFEIGRDFDVWTDISGLNYANQDNHDENEKKVTIEKVETIWAGRCYQISTHVKTQKLYKNMVVINFKESVIHTDIPRIKYYFTSESNALGVVYSEWVDGDVWSIEMRPNKKLWTIISLYQKKMTKLQTTSNCGNASSMKCVTYR